MRYLSRIIKSSRVSLGEQRELDAPVIIKKQEKIVQEEVNIPVEEKPVEKTREEIEAVYMEEARKKSELFFEEEMKRAYAEGITNANNESEMIIANAKVEAERLVAEAMQTKMNIANDYKNTMNSMEKEIVELALDIAKKIVAKEVEKDEYILGIVTEAVEKSASKKDTILKVSDSDYEFIVRNKDEILMNVEGFGEVEIIKEASLEKGSCLVETKFGIIDGSLKTRMSQIEKEVQRVLNR